MNSRISLAVVALVLVGGAIALWSSDRAAITPAATASEQPSISEAKATQKATAEPKAPPQPFVFAISWHPAFCEEKPSLAECRNQRNSDYEASNLTLHGLWPQDTYCGVSQRIIDLDRANRWRDLPEPALTGRTRNDLERVMPGVEDSLHRHEWHYHGTCSGASADTYFARSIALLEEVNASAVRELLARNIGKHVSRNQIRDAFDEAFGEGAGRRVRVDCETDGKRQLISELRINLEGNAMGLASLADLIHAARPASAGCNGGTVDPVGRQ